MRICLYDSGLGAYFLGQKLSNFKIEYFIDTKNYPYGTKSQKQLSSLIKANLKALDTKNYDLIIIACNTASIAIENDPKIIKHIKTEIVKITDWTKLYDLKNAGSIAIIGSTFTIKSNFYPQKLNKKIFPVDGQILINAIESKKPKNTAKQIIHLKKILESHKIKTLILGCTHFTGISSQLEQKLTCKIIDPSSILADYIQNKTFYF